MYEAGYQTRSAVGHYSYALLRRGSRVDRTAHEHQQEFRGLVDELEI